MSSGISNEKTTATWQTVVVIGPEYYDKGNCLVSPIDFGGGILLSQLPDWVRSSEMTKDMDCYQRDWVIGKGRLAFIAEYEAEPSMHLPGERSRPQDTILERILLANLAVWLAKPSWIGGRLYIHVRENNGERILRETSRIEPIRPHGRDGENHLETRDYEKAIKIYNALVSLDRSEAPWVAARTLLSGLSAQEWEIRFLLLWIALEALFGTSSEVSYRIAQRIAFFNTENRAEAKEVFDKIKNSYNWRSKIVHGLALRKLNREESEGVLYDTESMIRTSLQKTLLGERISDNFADKNREAYLDSLVFVARS